MSYEQEDKTVIANVASLMKDRDSEKKKSPASLIQYNGTGLGKRYQLDQIDIKIGRSPEAGICIPETSVSRFHARFFQTDQIFRVEDLASANGTYLNDQRITVATILKDQDVIRLGAVILKFFSGENIDGFVHDKIYRMATIDVGTQIFNKQYLLESLENEFRLAQTSGHRPLSIIYYDLDFFKKVNDTYGHNGGDVILKESAAVTKSAIRKDDLLCRYGGEEFVVILPNTTGVVAAELAERVRGAMERHPFILDVETPEGRKKVQHRQTISLGVSEYSSKMSSLKDLLESADKKLYQSKQTGRNRVTF